jgi:energy-coupling factor transporter ATP-binding protein EcfA2
MKQIKLSGFGPIHSADVRLGDLTILIGPQASGKTLFLQMLKLLVDKDYIVQTLTRYNYVTDKQPDQILNYYLGENLSTMWTKDTEVLADGNRFEKGFLMNIGDAEAPERLFYVPAQRILSISDGRPKNFMEYDISSPFVLRNFSETLRLFFQNGMGEEHRLFPLNNRLKKGMKDSFDTSIFHGGEVVIDERSGQKKMQMKVGETSLPFMTWSAGQKEFMPLLMAVYCLSGPPIKTINREQYEYVVIEEPEMGLHPKAIQAVILQVLEFITAGYKVILSTHSPVLLEFAWTLSMLETSPKGAREKALCDLFGVTYSSSVSKMLKGVVEKSVKTYFFSHTVEGAKAVDISSLDASSEQVDEAEWGGLSQFASRASEVVSKYLSEYGEA